jgi:hypothetical protein
MSVTDVIRRMVMAIQWVGNLHDMKTIKRELSCAGFDADEIEQYADCATAYVLHQRQLASGMNQMTTETPDEDK